MKNERDGADAFGMMWFKVRDYDRSGGLLLINSRRDRSNGVTDVLDSFVLARK